MHHLIILEIAQFALHSSYRIAQAETNIKIKKKNLLLSSQS